MKTLRQEYNFSRLGFTSHFRLSRSILSSLHSSSPSLFGHSFSEIAASSSPNTEANIPSMNCRTVPRWRVSRRWEGEGVVEAVEGGGGGEGGDV